MATTESDNRIDESLGFTAVDENSCIDVSLSDVLIFRAQPGSLPSLQSTTILSLRLRMEEVKTDLNIVRPQQLLIQIKLDKMVAE